MVHLGSAIDRINLVGRHCFGLLNNHMVVNRLTPLQHPLHDVAVTRVLKLKDLVHLWWEVLELVAKEHETSVDRARLDGFGSVEGLVDLVQLLFYYLNKLVKGVGRVATVRQLLLHHSRIIALLILHTGSARRLVLHHQFTHYVLLESSMSVAWLCPAVQVEAGAESLQRAAQHVCALEDS